MLAKMIHGLLIVDSHHMTRNKTKFEHMEYFGGGSVIFGNNGPC